MTYQSEPGHWNPSVPPPGSPPPGHYPPRGWNPQQPQKPGNVYKWLFIGVAVLLVIAITIGGTLFFTRDGSRPDQTDMASAPSNAKDVASVSDTGPVAIITADPTCSGWWTVQGPLAATESNGWGNRDQTSESSSWSPQSRGQYEAVGAAMRSAADQAVQLAKQTPHRVMREMYEQFIAYGRAYADSLSSYKPADDLLALANINFDGAIGGVCNAIDHGSIVSRVSLVPEAQPPSEPSLLDSVDNPDLFVSRASPTCSAWIKAKSTFESDLTEWGSLDPAIPSTAWAPEQRRVQEEAVRTIGTYASSMVSLGRQQHGQFEDFATLAALYLRAYVAASDSYTPADSWISTPGLRLNSAITEACKIAAG